MEDCPFILFFLSFIYLIFFPSFVTVCCNQAHFLETQLRNYIWVKYSDGNASVMFSHVLKALLPIKKMDYMSRDTFIISAFIYNKSVANFYFFIVSTWLNWSRAWKLPVWLTKWHVSSLHPLTNQQPPKEPAAWWIYGSEGGEGRGGGGTCVPPPVTTTNATDDPPLTTHQGLRHVMGLTFMTI